jgi:hypothetical protein
MSVTLIFMPLFPLPQTPPLTFCLCSSELWDVWVHKFLNVLCLALAALRVVALSDVI